MILLRSVIVIAVVWALSCGTDTRSRQTTPNANPPSTSGVDAGETTHPGDAGRSPSDATPTTPFFVFSASPRNGATLVYVGTPFEATFSEPLDPRSVTPESIRVAIAPSSGAPIAVRVTVSVVDDKVTVTPVVPFETNAVVAVTITTSLRARAGAALAREYRTSFTTRPWTIQTGTEYADFGSGVAVDATGNVFLGGGSSGNLHGLTLHEPPGENAADGFLSKYKPTGEREWTRLVGSPNLDGIGAVAVTASGDVVVAGSTGGSVDGQPRVGAYDVLVARFDTNGNRLWTKQFGSTGDDYDESLCVDAFGNILVTATTGSIGGQRGSGGSDIAVVKLSATGAWLWAKQFGSADDDMALAVATDSSGNVFVAAATMGALPGQTGVGGLDAALIKLDALGNSVWTRQFGTPQKDTAVGVAVDSTGAAYVLGWTEGGIDGNLSAGDADSYVTKFSAVGTKLWLRQFGSTRSDAASRHGIAAPSRGGVVVTGVTYGALDGATRQTDGDGFAVAFDANGAQLWLRQFGTTAHDYPAGLAVSGAGDIFVTGYSYGTFPGGRSEGDTDAFLVKLGPGGELR